jgi:hypothetical protein
MLTPEQNDAIFGFSIRVFRIIEQAGELTDLIDAIRRALTTNDLNKLVSSWDELSQALLPLAQPSTHT